MGKENLLDLITQVSCGELKFDRSNPKPFIDNVIIGCVRAGIPSSETIEYVQQKSGLELSFITTTALDLYSKYENEFGTKSIMYNLKLRDGLNEDDWRDMPYIPDEVYDNLPEIIKRSTSIFEEDRERDIFFTGAIVMVSGMLKNIYGVYHGRKTHPNLFGFVVAPAASGKGVLSFAKQMVIPAHNRLKANNPKQVLLIPANVTKTAMIEQLEKNGGSGIFFTTEADTLKTALKQEHGGFSDTLRAAFHHEPIDVQRKANDTLIEVQHPKLSILLSGTPNQVKGVIPNTADGLFSRFVFYTYKSKVQWKESNDNLLDNRFEEIGNDLLEMVSKISGSVQFKFTENQNNIFDRRFSEYLNEIQLHYDEESTSIITRMGVIMFRFAMILSYIRYVENLPEAEINPELEITIECNDIDFHVASMLTLTYIQHSMFAFVAMTTNKNNVVDRHIMIFYDILPNVEFTRAEIIKIVKNRNLGFADRTIDKYLKKLSDSAYLIQPKYGTYKKKTTLTT